MSYLFDGSGAGSSLAGTMASTYASDGVTLACFVKVTAHPIAVDFLFGFGNIVNNDDNGYRIRTLGTDDTWQASRDSNAGVLANASVVTNIDNVWSGIVATYTNSSLRNIYVGALANTAQNTTTGVVDNLLQFVRAGKSFDDSDGFTGRLAELAIWNNVMSSANITSYMSGAIASGISPANLIGYWPLSASGATQANLGTDTGGTLTVTSAVFDSDHPIITGGAVSPRGRMMMLGIG